MEIKHEKNGTKGAFYLIENDKRIGELAYVFAGDTKFIIDHTLVDPGHEGKGLGKKLVDAAVEFARENKFKIMPLCPYAKKVMEKSDAYKDVLF